MTLRTTCIVVGTVLALVLASCNAQAAQIIPVPSPVDDIISDVVACAGALTPIVHAGGAINFDNGGDGLGGGYRVGLNDQRHSFYEAAYYVLPNYQPNGDVAYLMTGFTTDPDISGVGCLLNSTSCILPLLRNCTMQKISLCSLSYQAEMDQWTQATLEAASNQAWTEIQAPPTPPDPSSCVG